MMSETSHVPETDNVEASFEIVNAAATNGGGGGGMQQNSQSSITVPPPPSALPAFAQLSSAAAPPPPPPPPPGGAPVEQSAPPPPAPASNVTAPPPAATTTNQSASTAAAAANQSAATAAAANQSATATPPTNPFSVRATAGQSLTAAAMHAPPPSSYNAPPPPLANIVGPPASAYAPPPVQPSMMTSPAAPYGYNLASNDPISMQQHHHTGLDIPFDVSGGNQPSDPSSPLSASSSYHQQKPGGVWQWFNKTISNSDFLTKMAEKAKTSVDNMLTTLDPQMKDYINPAAAVELCVATADFDLASAVKAGFSRYFPNSVVRGVPPAFAPTVAQQPVGFDNGVQAVKDSVQALRQSGLVAQNSLVLAFNSFLAQLNAQHWYEFYCVSLSNGSNIYFHTFTQPVPVPDFVMDILKNQTPADYPQASNGFAFSVDQVMTHSHGLLSSTWHMQYAGLTRSELIGQACVSLAYMYKSVM